MASYKLDIFNQAQLDPDYSYRWASDDASRLRMLTKHDDYDFVDAAEIDDFNAGEETDSESDGRVRMIVGEKASGKPHYQYLLRKRREFVAEDAAAQRDYWDNMLKGRIIDGQMGNISARSYRDGEVVETAPKEADTSHFYVAPEASLGDRRRGKVTPEEAGA
jgi:hypothetical protein